MIDDFVLDVTHGIHQQMISTVFRCIFNGKRQQTKNNELWIRKWNKFIAIAILIWLLVFRILVPILRQLAIPPAPQPMAESGREAMAQGRENAGYQDNLQAARQLARQDPKVVANVVKEWVGGGE